MEAEKQKKESFTERLKKSKLMEQAVVPKHNVEDVTLEVLKVGRKVGGSHIGTRVEKYFTNDMEKTVTIPLSLWKKLMVKKAEDDKDIKILLAEAIVDFLKLEEK